MTNLAKMKEASISDLKDLESRIEQMTAAEYYNFLSLLEEYDKLTPYFKACCCMKYPCSFSMRQMQRTFRRMPGRIRRHKMYS